MTRTYLTYLLFFVHVLVSASAPSSPYHLFEPELNDLIPFSTSEMQAMHELGITRVEVQYSNDLKTVYLIDDQGRLFKQEDIYIKKGRATSTEECIYQYNASGKLISRRCTNPIDVFLDTIAYDSNDRVIYYLSQRTTKKGSKKWRGTHVEQELRYYASDQGHTTLLDSTEFNHRYITFNNENEVIRIESEGRSDSISVELDTSGVTRKKYWYRIDHPEYRLGKEIVRRNGQPLSERIWNMIGDGRAVAYITNYHYDDDHLLYKTDSASEYQQKDLYTYYDNGMKMEHITIHIDRVVVRRFRYWYN